MAKPSNSTDVARRTNAAARWALIFGVAGFVLSPVALGGMLGLIAVVLGIVGVTRPRRRWMAIVGLVAGPVAVVASIIALTMGLMFYSIWSTEAGTRRFLADADVVGSWKLTNASIDYFVHDGLVRTPGKDYTITFQADHTLTFSSVDDCDPRPVEITCTGRWSLTHPSRADFTQPKNELYVEIDAPRGRTGSTLRFRDAGVNVKLWNYHKDPDAMQYIEYEKTGAAP